MKKYKRNEVVDSTRPYESCKHYVFGKRGVLFCVPDCINKTKCPYYINAYWFAHRSLHYHKRNRTFPTTLDAWRKYKDYLERL